jgi:hypothetical protein
MINYHKLDKVNNVSISTVAQPPNGLGAFVFFPDFSEERSVFRSAFHISEERLRFQKCVRDFGSAFQISEERSVSGK